MNGDVSQAREAIRRCRGLRDAGSAEAVLRGEFHSHLRRIFPDDSDQRWIDHYGEGAEARASVGIASGYAVNRFIDNLIGSTTIEYESDLRVEAKRKKGLEQVREHVTGLLRHGVPVSQVRGVLSDTVEWYAYDVKVAPGVDPVSCTVEDVVLGEVDRLLLTTDDDPAATRLIAFVRRHLARERSRLLTAAQLTLDLGLESASYKDSAGQLRDVVVQGRAASSSIMLATDLWSRFVDRLEGQASGFRAAAYVDEVYLCILARLLSANTLAGQAMSSDEAELKAILDGSHFRHRYQLANMVEKDYFGWIIDPAHIGRFVPIARQLQQDLVTYDFSHRPEGDLFGRLMAQLARSSQRMLLGQEWTPAWLGRLLAKRCLDGLPEGENPRVIDMCCGSGSILAEVLAEARERFGPSDIAALHDVATGFDIDPLAVSLAKTTWVIALADEIKVTTTPIDIPIYHADSLFAVTPVTPQLPPVDGNGSFPVSLDGHTVELPAALLRPENRELFDGIIDWAHDGALDVRSRGQSDHLTEPAAERFIDGVTGSLDITLDDEFKTALIPHVSELARRMAELAVADRNGIWAFILRNTYRPGLLSGQFNGLVSNPPWLALSRLAENPYRGALTQRAETYGIRPEGSSFPHLDLGTTHLLHAVDRYLDIGASVACLVPGTILNGHHHEPFRQRRFLSANRPVALEIEEVWQVERNTFKYPGAGIIGHKRKKLSCHGTASIEGFIAGQSGLEKTDFSVRSIDDKRTAWVLEKGDLPVNASMVTDLPQQGADLMPRRAVCIEILSNAGREYRVDTPSPGTSWAFTVKKAKELKQKRFPGQVAPQFIHCMAQSENLLPFVFGAHRASIAIPAQRDATGAWRLYGESEIRGMGFIETARRFRDINDKLKNVGNGLSLQERIDVRSKLTKQDFGAGSHLVVSGAGGKHICAACIPVDDATGLVIDQTLYWRVVHDEDEAWYQVGMLESHAMTEAVMPFNPRGAFGERHIHTLPYQIMPVFDRSNDDHSRIGELARHLADEALKIVNADMHLGDPSKALASRRRRLRKRLWATDAFQELEQLCSAALGTTPFGGDADAHGQG